MTTVHGTTLRSLDRDGLVDGLETLRPALLDALAGADRAVLVPDVHYPYHPSTGMVTNPDVVEALASTLAVRLPDADVSVAVRSGDAVDTERALSFLGYDELDSSGEVDVDVVGGESGPGGVTSGSGDSTSGGGTDGTPEPQASVPAALADAAVVPVPSARVAGTVPMMGSLGVLATAVGADPTDATQVREAVEAVGPAAAVVDATYAFTGEPTAARAVFCGDDVAAVDGVLAELLGVDQGDVPGLADVAESRPDDPVSVDGLDVAGLAADLPNGGIPASTDPHPIVRAGYRLYTKVSGDVYPPQLRGGR